MKEKIKLKDVAIHSKGKQINGSDLVEDGKYDYLNGGINPSGRWNEYNTNGCTVTISEGGNSSGYVNYMEEPFWCGAHCYFLSGVKGNPKYLYFALKSKQEQIMNLRTGATMPNIKKSVLGEFEFTYDSSLEEQDKVVSVLERIEKIISYKNEQLYAIDNLIKSRFVEMFGDPTTNPKGWKKNKLGECVLIPPQNGLYKPSSDYVNDNSGTPILRIDGFYDGIVKDFSSLKRLICDEKEIFKYLLKEDDIVINRVNSIEYLGKCAHICDMKENTVFESNMMRFHLYDDRFSAVYVSKLLCTDFIYGQVIKHAKKAVNQASINQNDVQDFDIYEPPIKLQNQFAAFVHHVDKLKVDVQKSLDETKMLFDSLMQKYFE